jgi:IS30 family transposase
MSFDQKIADFLARSEAKQAPSKLEPFAELIRTLRQRRWTFGQIAAALLEEFGVRVHPTTIHAYVKVRVRRGRAVELPGLGTIHEQVKPAPRKQRFNLDA